MNRCPFKALRRKEGGVFEVCVYAFYNVSCDDLELNPQNSDAWCYRMIEKGMEDYGM